jgi:hypothetical protein
MRLANAGTTSEVVITTGDVTADLDRRQLITTVTALELAAGALQRVALAPRPGLELRTRALYDMDFTDWRRSADTSRLLARAEERIAEREGRA